MESTPTVKNQYRTVAAKISFNWFDLQIGFWFFMVINKPTVNGMSVSATPHCRLWTYLFYPESDSHNKTQQT
jgi:hypothetical protein